MAARKLRHDFLARAAAARRIPAIALAHHADDQGELFFVRLLRGAGGEGLAGMKWQSRSPANPKITLVRPLLDQPKSALKQYAKQERVAFREDASNSRLDIQRNRIRRELLPLLKRHYQPALERVVLRQMEILGAEAELVSEAAKYWLKQKGGAKFDELPVAVQRRCLQLQLAALDVTPNFDVVEHLREHPNRPVTVSERVTVCRDESGRVNVPESGNSTFEGGAVKVRLEGGGGEISFENTLISWKLQNAAAGTFRAPKPRVNGESFDADKLGSDIVLRHWRRGDRFQPIGLAAPAKLQDLFINQKIPRAQRHRLLVGTAAEGELFWVEGLRLGERFKLDKNTRYQLHWRWKQVL
jgi:tRNA(Ile)-lysidine synthase